MRDSSRYGVDMLNGSLVDKMIFFALPIAASSILQQLFNSADIAVVGRFAGPDALAAVGSNGPVINLLITLFIGLSVGTNVVISRAIGQGQRKTVSDAVHTAIAVALFSGFLMAFVGQFASVWLLGIMKTPSSVLVLASRYLRIYFAGMPFIMLYNFGAAILRSKGDSRRPLYCLMGAGVCNVILNCIFVIGCGMSVDGVAIATVISNAFSAGAVTMLLMHEEEPFRLKITSIRFHIPELKIMTAIGLPAGIQGSMFSFSNVFVQTAINGFGATAVAGSATALNYEFFTWFFSDAFGQAVVTFTGQNFGAGDFPRCRRIFYTGMLCTFLCTLIIGLSISYSAPVLVRVFTTDPGVSRFAVTRMRCVVTGAFLTTGYMIAGAALRGMGHSMSPAVMTILGTCVFRVVWIFTVLKIHHRFDVLMYVYPVTWILTSAMTLFWYFHIRHRVENR